MVLRVLYVKAQLENVASITFPADYNYCFDVKDAQSSEEKDGVFVCRDEVVEIDGSKGDTNFAMRFPDCKKQCTITFTDVKKLTRDSIEAGDSVPRVLWLRYNPHAYRVDGDLVSIPKVEREDWLVAFLRDAVLDEPLAIAYAFYDSADGQLEVLDNPEYHASFRSVASDVSPAA